MSAPPRTTLARRSLLTLGVAAALRPAQAGSSRAERLGAALAAIPAIDNHTHLLGQAPPYNPSADASVPLLLRSSRPETVAVLRERFGIEWQVARGAELDAEGRARRQRRLETLGASAYWADHLKAANCDTVLVNQEQAEGCDGRSLRWVGYGSTLLSPVPAAALAGKLARSQAQLRAYWRLDGNEAGPETLADYLVFLDRRLATMKAQGLVALKFTEAYYRSLRIADVPTDEAAVLYAKGRAGTALSLEELLRLQDHLWRQLLARCGPLGLPVHIHSSHGAGSQLRLLDADVRLLESVLVPNQFPKTQFVLIHGGAPQHEAAAYLAASKPNVWLDVSAMPFLYPPSDMARVLRTYLGFAPERVLFGTDPMPPPTVPVGPEVAHLMLCRVLRRALTLALDSLTEEGVLDEAQALALGRGVLRGHAQRLYGWA